MAVKEKSGDGESPPMEWSAEEEIQLFKALGGLKPIGINKHFYMACICGRLSAALKRDIYPDVVWAHLQTMYNLEILDSMEPLPFPQDQSDFSLPDAEFSELMAKKLEDVDQQGGGSDEAVDQREDHQPQVAPERVEHQHLALASPVVKSRTATPQPVAIPAKHSQSRPSSQSSTSSSKSLSTTPAGSNANAAASSANPSHSITATPSIAAPAINTSSHVKSFAQRELEKKIAAKLAALETPKRTTKRTRGSMSIESNSPSTTPPPQTHSKRRRI